MFDVSISERNIWEATVLFKETALKMLEIQDDEWPLKTISSGIQVDNAEHFLVSILYTNLSTNIF